MLVLLQAAYNFAIAVRIRWYLQNLMLIVNAKYSTRTSVCDLVLLLNLRPLN